MSEPTLVMKLTALRDYVMVLGVSEDDCEVFDEAVEALYNARSAALEEAAMVAQRMADDNSLSGGEPWICEVVARDIRSLKDKDTRTPTEGDLL